jgi:hypothetical protein
MKIKCKPLSGDTNFDRTGYYNEGNYSRFNPNCKRGQSSTEGSVKNVMRKK